MKEPELESKIPVILQDEKKTIHQEKRKERERKETSDLWSFTAEKKEKRKHVFEIKSSF